MDYLRSFATLIFSVAFYLSLGQPLVAAEDSMYRYSLTMIDGQKKALSDYKGKVLLIVNTASQCGYTDQYEGLEKLYKKHSAEGLIVLGVPSNSFNQELSDDKKVANFCKFKFGVTFPLSKITAVKGEEQHPLFKFLTQNSTKQLAGPVKWNFEKFLVGPDGKVVARFKSSVEPTDPKLLSQINDLLKK